MRAGTSSSCAAQQTLSAEAASVLKISLSLARRRGHAQVTPLHVAATLLTSRAGLLRRACLRSQPPHHIAGHPLQCRALELCFNVALNRLPAAPGPLLAAAQPSLSNALVAALKRAQAHQRRGCIEQQQSHHHQQPPPPLVAVKVELEQLVLSILDDPSVSRVMREAGFSSAAVKNNLEDATLSSVSSVFQCYSTSGGIYSTPNSPPTETHHSINPRGAFWPSHLLSCAADQNPLLFSPPKKPCADFSSLTEDVKVVMEVLLGKKRKNTVVVGDSLSMAEHVVSEIMARVERGDVPEELKSAHFIKFQFSSVPLKFMKREEVETNIADLKRKVDSFGSSGCGVIIYTGDLKWTVDIECDDEKEDSDSVYRPVDHLVSEMGKLLSWYNNSNHLNTMRVWLMATANYQTYTKCQMKQPPLDLHWGLQAVSVPSNGLGLSLNATSGDDDSRTKFLVNPTPDSDRKLFFVQEEQEVLSCCQECKSNYEKEATFNSANYPAETNGSAHLPFWLKPQGVESLVKDDLVQLRRKYNKLCQSLHKGSHSPSNSVIRNQSYHTKDHSYLPSSYPNWPNKNLGGIFSDSETISFTSYPSAKTNSHIPSTLPRFRRQQSCHIDFSFSNGSSKNRSAEPNLVSLKGNDDREVKITLALGNSTFDDDRTPKVESENYRDLVKLFQENLPWQSHSIPSVLEALLARSKTGNEKNFLLIKGDDVIGKRRLAVGIASFVFSSPDFLFRMNMKKNAWDRKKMEKALRDNEKLVVLVENVDYADGEFAKFLDEAHERVAGRVVFILTIDYEENGCNGPEEKSADHLLPMKLVLTDDSKIEKVLDRNNKRKANIDLPEVPVKSKSQKNNETEKRDALDLNIEADDRDELKAIKDDSLMRFLEKVENRYVFYRDKDQESRMKEVLSGKLKGSFEEVSGYRKSLDFSVESEVLEEILRGSGLYVDGLFDRWVKEVFETGLREIVSGEGERGRVRLCLDVVCSEEDGFMGTCLPKRIQVSFTG